MPYRTSSRSRDALRTSERLPTPEELAQIQLPTDIPTGDEIQKFIDSTTEAGIKEQMQELDLFSIYTQYERSLSRVNLENWNYNTEIGLK
jgi:hypothetical protein